MSLQIVCIIHVRYIFKNEEANRTHPSHNAACTRAPVTRWELYDNRLLCQLPDIITHS